MNKKSMLSLAWWIASERTIDKAPAIDKRWDNGRFSIDFEASIGQVIGIGVTAEAKRVSLPCGHPFGGVRIDFYLGPLHVGICVASSYKAHDERHRQIEAEQALPPEVTPEMLREADIQGLEELKAMAAQIGAPIEQLVDGLPEPLRSEMLRRLGISPDVPDLTATQINAALEAIRQGRAGQ